MTVYLVIWIGTSRIESVHASRHLAESQVWALGDVGFEIVEMPVLGVAA